ncbi:MAG: hypothetical protein DHS80DRAFT_22252 [Piptocephalis tieghemiana]|nr:MAG: hypothetical protein DHS80DRAFT_22252 [Piptocephalis tieghemiana]
MSDPFFDEIIGLTPATSVPSSAPTASSIANPLQPFEGPGSPPSAFGLVSTDQSSGHQDLQSQQPQQQAFLDLLHLQSQSGAPSPSASTMTPSALTHPPSPAASSSSSSIIPSPVTSPTAPLSSASGASPSGVENPSYPSVTDWSSVCDPATAAAMAMVAASGGMPPLSLPTDDSSMNQWTGGQESGGEVNSATSALHAAYGLGATSGTSASGAPEMGLPTDPSTYVHLLEQGNPETIAAQQGQYASSQAATMSSLEAHQQNQFFQGAHPYAHVTASGMILPTGTEHLQAPPTPNTPARSINPAYLSMAGEAAHTNLAAVSGARSPMSPAQAVTGPDYATAVAAAAAGHMPPGYYDFSLLSHLPSPGPSPRSSGPHGAGHHTKSRAHMTNSSAYQRRRAMEAAGMDGAGVGKGKMPRGTGGPREFSCTGFPGCNMVFNRQEHLIRHIDGKHRGLKPHVCEMCGNRFTRADNVKQHARACQRRRERQAMIKQEADAKRARDLTFPIFA